MSRPNRYSIEPTVLPALAAVVATAVLLSMAMTTGATPRLAPVEAVQAVFLRSATTSQAAVPRTVAREVAAEVSRTSLDSTATLPPISAWTANDVFGQVAPVGPARGKLPPPMA